MTARRAFSGWVVLPVALAIIPLSIGTLFTLGVFMRPMVGEKVPGTAYGIVFFISCIGMGLGSWAGDLTRDAFGSFQWLFLGSLAIGGTAVILAVSLRPPSPALLAVPAQRPPSSACGGCWGMERFTLRALRALRLDRPSVLC